MTLTVRAERKNNCFSSNTEEWCLRVHPHFAGQFILETVSAYSNDEWNIVKTGTYAEVKTFAEEKLAEEYEEELEELFENIDDTLCYRNEYDHSLMTYDNYMERCFDLHLVHDCSLQEILINDDEYVQVYISNETGEVYIER